MPHKVSWTQEAKASQESSVLPQKTTFAPVQPHLCDLVGPISRDIAIVSLRYPLSRHPSNPPTGCDTPPPLGVFFCTDISVRYPILQHIARYSCDTPGKQARKSFAILSLKLSRDMKSIAAGPLSVTSHRCKRLFARWVQKTCRTSSQLLLGNFPFPGNFPGQWLPDPILKLELLLQSHYTPPLQNIADSPLLFFDLPICNYFELISRKFTDIASDP